MVTPRFMSRFIDLRKNWILEHCSPVLEGDEFSTTIHGYLVPLEMLLQRRFRDGVMKIIKKLVLN